MNQAPNDRRRGRKLAVATLALAGVVVAWQFGVFDAFASAETMKRTLLGLGPWGWLAFVGAYASLQPFGLPGTVFVWGAPLIWPWPVAFALSMTGTMAASVVGFSFARFVARDWVSARIPARYHRYDDALAARGLLTVVLLRFTLWMPPPLHFFFGVSKVGFWTHFWGSWIGYLIPMFLVSFFGERIVGMVFGAPTWVWASLGVAAIGLLLLLGGRARRRARPASGHLSTPTPTSPDDEPGRSSAPPRSSTP
jgi:uncharacterized membrane protein YdjX (TVP38/TMEM64 family)